MHPCPHGTWSTSRARRTWLHLCVPPPSTMAPLHMCASRPSCRQARAFRVICQKLSLCVGCGKISHQTLHDSMDNPIGELCDDLQRISRRLANAEHMAAQRSLARDLGVVVESPDRKQGDEMAHRRLAQRICVVFEAMVRLLQVLRACDS